MLSIACALSLSGCVHTERPHAAAVDASLTSARLTQGVTCGSVELAPGAVHHQPIGAKNGGRFDDDDAAALRTTLVNSLAAATPASSSQALQTHVRIQHFATAYTNSRFTVLAAVDWCVAKGNEPLHSERFWAAYDTGEWVVKYELLGDAKQRAMDAIAKRIAERALAVANTRPLPPAPEFTFDTQALALNTLPKSLQIIEPARMRSPHDRLEDRPLAGTFAAAQLAPKEPLRETSWPEALAQPKAL